MQTTTTHVAESETCNRIGSAVLVAAPLDQSVNIHATISVSNIARYRATDTLVMQTHTYIQGGGMRSAIFCAFSFFVC